MRFEHIPPKSQVCTPRPRGLGERLAVDATRRWPCLPATGTAPHVPCRHTRRRRSATAKPRDAVHRTPRTATSREPAAAYRRHGGPNVPCEALCTPLPSTDALGTLFTLRVASQRRDSTAKALAEPFLERCKPASGSWRGCSRPLQARCCSLPSAEFRPKTLRFRRFRLQK